MIPHGIGIGPNPPQFVTNGNVFQPSWTVDPYHPAAVAGVIASTPQAQAVEWELERTGTPVVILPWTPVSYPSNGGAPRLFPAHPGSTVRYTSSVG